MGLTVEQKQAIAIAEAKLKIKQRLKSDVSPVPGYQRTALRGAIGALDLAQTGIRGLGKRILGGALAAPVILQDPQSGERIFEKYSQPPQPLTESGRNISEAIAPIAETVETGVTDVFGAVPGPPALKAGVRTVVQAPLELLLLRGAGSVGRAAGSAPTAPGTFVPTVKDLFAAGRVAFNEARIRAGGVRPQALRRASDSIRNIKNDVGLKIPFDRDVHGPAFVVRQRLLDDLDGGNIDFDNLLTLRELAGDVAGNADRAISMRGVRMKNAIDDFVDSLGPDDVISGDPQRAAQALNSARKFWRDASVARTIEKEIELAGNRAGQFSGSGFENALRTQFRQLNARIIKGRERGFSADEIAAIRRVAEGGKLDNFWRFFGKLAPTGVVSGGIGVGAGYAIGGEIGAAAVPAGGALSRWLATRGTIGNANRALEVPLRSSLLDPSL